MGVPLRLMEGTICLLCNLCPCTSCMTKKIPTFLFHFACLYSIPFFLDFIFVSCTPRAVSFPIYNCPHNSIRHLPTVSWNMIGIYTYFFLMFSLLPCRVSWAEAAKVEMGFFMIQNFCLLFREDSQRRCLVIEADEVDHGSSFLRG